MSGTHTPPTAELETAPQNGVTDLINNSSNTGREATQQIASLALERLARMAEQAGRSGASRGLGVAGALVSPAVWVLQGQAPTSSEAAFWGLGTIASVAGGAIGSGATMVTGLVKAVLEDREDEEIARAVANEPERYRRFIRSVRHYSGWTGRGIEAMTIAHHGGVAWRIGRSSWVYIRDARDRLICDYRPVHAYEVLGPTLPLRILGREGGRTQFQWRRTRGTLTGG
jgi:hypothetical protein